MLILRERRPLISHESILVRSLHDLEDSLPVLGLGIHYVFSTLDSFSSPNEPSPIMSAPSSREIKRLLVANRSVYLEQLSSKMMLTLNQEARLQPESSPQPGNLGSKRMVYTYQETLLTLYGPLLPLSCHRQQPL